MRGPRAAMAAGGGEKKKRISITMKKPKGGAAVSYTHLTLPTICSV